MWVALMAVSLTAQETVLQDQPSESDTPDTAANEVSNESGSLLESISTTQIDSSESKDPIPSEEGAVAEDLPSSSTSEQADEVGDSQAEAMVVENKGQKITIGSGVIKVEETDGTPAIPAPPPAPAAPEEQPTKKKREPLQDMVRVFAEGVIGPNESAKDFVVIGGQGVVEGLVDGDGVVVFGNAIINGRIDGDFVNILGTTSLGPDAEIEGELVVVGRLVKAEGAKVYGDVVEITFLPDFTAGHFKWVGEWFRSGLLMGRPLPHDQSWAWIAAGVLLLIGLLISLIFRRAIDSTSQVLDSRPAASLLTGMLIFILSGPLCFILTVSVIGILIIPFYTAGLVVAGVFGIIAVYRFCGQQLGLGSIPALALLAGGVIFTLLYAVPIVGFLVWFLALILGTGAVFLALVKGLKGEGKDTGPTTVPTSPISPIPVKTDSSLSGDATASPPGFDEGLKADGKPAPQSTAITETSDDPMMAERVGFWPRLGATALDFILIAGLVRFTGQEWMLPFAWIAYHVVFWTWRQTTIGGVVLNLKVVRIDGQPLNFGIIVVRSLSSIFSGIVFGLGFFWASWDDERQSWHDKIAGTTIVRVPKGTSLL
jgi:uncharacterized RDD family membrane protein YckC